VSAASEQIRQSRSRAGLTQHQLAELTGVRQPNIAAYENGQRVPSQGMLERLLSAARPRPSQVLELHREQVRQLARRHRADSIRVFGSVARGNDGPDSDLDFLVTFDEHASLLDQAELNADLEDLLGIPVHVVSDRSLRDRDAQIVREAVAV
jgi:predicted nucleotidyltransferase